MNNLKAERTLTAEGRESDEMLAAIKRIRDAAMLWTIKGQIPEAGAFGVIAQDADWLCDQLQSLSTQQPMGEVRVKALEWEAVTDQIPNHAYAAYTPFSRLLIVCEFSSINRMAYRFNGTDFYTLNAAKEAAQKDYDGRVLSAIITEGMSDE